MDWCRYPKVRRKTDQVLCDDLALSSTALRIELQEEHDLWGLIGGFLCCCCRFCGRQGLRSRLTLQLWLTATIAVVSICAREVIVVRCRRWWWKWGIGTDPLPLWVLWLCWLGWSWEKAAHDEYRGGSGEGLSDRKNGGLLEEEEERCGLSWGWRLFLSIFYLSRERDTDNALQTRRWCGNERTMQSGMSSDRPGRSWGQERWAGVRRTRYRSWWGSVTTLNLK